MKDSERWCFTCRNYLLCFWRRGFEDVIEGGLRMFIPDKVQTETPGFYQDIYKAVAACCLRYEYREEK